MNLIPPIRLDLAQNLTKQLSTINEIYPNFLNSQKCFFYMFFSLKDSFLKTINTFIVNNHPPIATATVGSFCRIFIFIDGSNFYHSPKRSFGSTSLE